MVDIPGMATAVYFAVLVALRRIFYFGPRRSPDRRQELSL